MKKTKTINLILITAALAGCNQKKEENEWNSGNKTFIRSDSTAPYARTHHGAGSMLLWYYAFRPFSSYRNGEYQRSGYYSGAIPHKANTGTNSSKALVPRGGFGRTGARASS